MVKPRITVDLFCEDRGHEEYARSMVKRLAREANTPEPRFNARSVRGGHGRALTELVGWQRLKFESRGQLLVVLIDGNSVGWHQQRAAVTEAVEPDRRDGLVIGCPDPYVEAWIAADLEAVYAGLGVRLAEPPKEKKPDYKRWLSEALEVAGVPVLTNAADIAMDVIPHLDLYRASQASPSLKDFIDTLRRELKRAAG
jgi:hypothetical protein